jgi:hypothetical protein
MADGRVVLRLGPLTNPIHGMAGCDHKRLMNGNCCCATFGVSRMATLVVSG